MDLRIFDSIVGALVYIIRSGVLRAIAGVGIIGIIVHNSYRLHKISNPDYRGDELNSHF